MNWEYITVLLGSIGGLELFKFIYNFFIRRKTDARIALVEAKSTEFTQLQATIEWLQGQLQAKEERFQEQTDNVRRLNVEILNTSRELAKKEIEFAKERAGLEILLMEVRCDDKPCPFRLPPNAYTPPQQNETKEERGKMRVQS